MPTLAEVTRDAIDPALAFLPRAMDSIEARLLLLAIGLQESKLHHRWQVVDLKRPEKRGPARGLWQFERGTRASRGGVWGVMLHEASRYWLAQLCAFRHCPFTAAEIHVRIEQDDVLAAGLARLLLFTDPKKLPDVNDVQGAWKLYALRCWRPGKPHPETWPGYHAQARRFVLANPATTAPRFDRVVSSVTSTEKPR